MGSIIAQCNIGSPPKCLKGTLGVSSNFISHLRTRHQEQYEQYLIDKAEVGKQSGNFDTRILKYLASSHSPLSTVDNPGFINMFKGTELVVKSRGTMTKILKDTHTDMVHKIKTLCTIADIWSARQRSFLGYTIHWIDKKSLKRYSLTLA